MEAAGGVSMLRDGVPLLGFALVFVLLFRRFGLGATLGYLVAGALVGPQVLRLVGGAEAKMGIAELGITLLLFLVGLELNPSRLWRMRRDIFGFGLLQVVLCGLAISGVVCAAHRLLVRGGAGARAAARACPRPRRCCRCCSRRGGCARRSASAPSRSCCSRTCRSCR